VRALLVVAAEAADREVIRRGLELQLGPGWPSTQSAIVLAIDTCPDREGALRLLRERAEQPHADPYEVLIIDTAGLSQPELRLLVGTARALFMRVRIVIVGEGCEEADAAAIGAHRALPRPFTIAALAAIVGGWLRHDSERRSWDPR
jgi:hypothetical protein